MDYFAHKSSQYESDENRVKNVNKIAHDIIKKIELKKEMKIADFGSGTGLLSSGIAPFVSKITGIDMSKAMNEEFLKKKDTIGCQLDIKEIDLSIEMVNEKFDGVISSMSIHHIKDIKQLFEKFYEMLEVDGFIALADLDSEDGSFHKEDTGVFHFGFDRREFLKVAKEVGFSELQISFSSVVSKPYGDYSVFLLTGYKRQ